mmetsp:Transcript_9892/g.26915  ORF Transcript_9892/g.26915 Transcript_9892/m.26915 type:complete len:221 (+) Transcript_9892:283-945(+)|eukprot:CAMPEP_0197473408 /NCGR_PEP_ID=MMETSP1309-20131121/4764_1 /TAXON_ID=464262 /ORGANISM="Genus nov. species nov., Strain RCC998" /LENGTH=220 /DNA_ID=CAMNT_0043012501 /DNA_START=303 /DNA_END=965 /DNA_ORIENTATION=+
MVNVKKAGQSSQPGAFLPYSGKKKGDENIASTSSGKAQAAEVSNEFSFKPTTSASDQATTSNTKMKKASKGKTQEGAQATTSDVGGEPSRDDTQAKSTSGKGKSAAVKNDDTAMGEEEFNKVMKRRRQDAERKRKQRANASDEVRRLEREKDAERKRKKRKQIIKSPNELKKRREKDAARMRQKRAQATPEEKIAMKEKDAKRKKEERAKKHEGKKSSST